MGWDGKMGGWCMHRKAFLFLEAWFLEAGWGA
jgi:hypothetical protein